MTLKLRLVSENRNLLGDDSVREFQEEGGTIGRSLENDWILPDPDRYVSGRHATIDHKGGIYYLLDTSSNGVYINDDVEPIGKGYPRRLFDGDRVRMGEFEFAVSLDSGESLEMPLDPEPSVAPDHIEQLVEEDSLRTGVKLIDEEEITGDDEFQSVLFGKTDDTHTSTPRPRRKRAANDGRPVRKRSKPAAKTSENVDVSADDLFDSLLDGLGISRVELHPSVNRSELMLTAGQVLREFVQGIIKLLAARANLKNTFRLDQTTVLPRYNNPLKLSASPTDLIKQLLVGDEGDYLNPKDAVHEACHDLLNHQNAFLDAMNSAFIEFSERFEPDELEQGFDRAMTTSKLLAFTQKSKYWDLYRDLYPILTEKGKGRFPQMFGEEFVRAYERQVADYERRDREQQTERDDRSANVKPELLATQKLDKPVADSNTEEEVEPVDASSETRAEEIDQSFIDELDNSMAEELSGNT
jgi:predicted component of type VI protein secretion system